MSFVLDDFEGEKLAESCMAGIAALVVLGVMLGLSLPALILAGTLTALLATYQFRENIARAFATPGRSTK